MTVSSSTVSVATKLGEVMRDSAISSTTVTVAWETFLADRIEKTLRRTSHSGWSGRRLARSGKYLSERERHRKRGRETLHISSERERERERHRKRGGET